MKKRRLLRLGGCENFPRKMWLIMKLGAIFCFLLSVNVSANVYSQQNKVSLNLSDVTLEEFIEAIRQQTGVNFLYNASLFRNTDRISVKVKKESLDRVLKTTLEQSGFTFDYQEDVVVIKKGSAVDFLPQQAMTTVKGIVKDVSGIPLPGVTIIIKGSQTGVATDIDGRFELKIKEDPNAVLVFSFVGMKSKEVKVGTQKEIQVTLESDSQALEEVICTGFQTISRERATGSFQILSNDELSKIPAQDLGAKLEGLATGMQVDYDEQSGKTDVTIRGIATMNADAKPLIVVDGFPVEGDFSTINPNDIENVTVLKDAAAASIWGARAGNGVVVVVTKSGKKAEKLSVSFDAFVKFSPKMDLDYNFPIADSDTQLAYEKFETDGGFGTSWGTPDTFNEIWQVYTLGAQLMYNLNKGLISQSDYDMAIAKLRNTSNKRDIKKYMLNNPFSQNYNLSINGGGKIHAYNLSAMYSSDENNMAGNKREKLLINFKNTFEIKKWLNFDFALTSEMKKDKEGLSISNINELSPYELLKNGDGAYAPVMHSYNKRLMDEFMASAQGMPYTNMDYNPLQDLDANDFTTREMNLRFQAGLNVKFMEGLDYRGSFQYERFDNKVDKFYGEESFYVRDLANNNILFDEATKTVKEKYMPEGDILASSEILKQTYNLRNQLNFNRVFAEKHSVSVLLGTELIWSESKGAGNTLYGYNGDMNTHVTPPYGYGSSVKVWKKFFDNYFTGELPTGHDLTYTAQRYLALYGNATYMFNEKYSVSGSVRNDASNIVVDDPKYRYSPFWSVGLGWNISNEEFIRKIDFIDRLAIRATYGKNGNTVTTASSIPIIAYSASPSPITGEFYGTIRDKGNPTLRWENINQFNVGVDFSFWHKLSGSIDVYSKKSTDLLANVAVSPTYGSTSQTFNAAAVRNNGFELDLNYNQRIAGDFRWNTGFKLSYNKSEVTDFKQQLISPRSMTGYRFVEGYAVDPVFSFIYGGMSEDGKAQILSEKTDDIYTMEEHIGLNGEDGKEVLKYHGTATPPLIMGWTNTFTYKGITLKAMITGKFGHKFRRPTFMYTDGFDKNYHKDLEGIMAGNARQMGLPEIPAEYTDYYYRYSWYVPYLNTLVENASHIRLREIYLGYDLPKKLCDKMKLGSIRIYSQIRNLGLIWAANKQDIDPDYISGIDIKPEASYTFGLNINF